jgi:hypothetical protein
MNVVIAGITLATVAAAVGTAFAQSPADLLEQQRWRALLPAVRTSTDCFAREVLNHPRVLEAVSADRQSGAQQRLDGLFGEISRAGCQAELNFMVSEHDRIYGQGTGWPFARGPYRADLPRAVLARAGTEIERRIAHAEKLEAEHFIACPRCCRWLTDARLRRVPCSKPCLFLQS